MGGLAPGSRGLAPASMGPRRVPRKWSLLVAPISVSHRLQWGRGVCLGNGSLDRRGQKTRTACFNGAEACASEMAPVHGSPSGRGSSFNGAEACASEMVRHHRSCHYGHSRFNGAEACASEMESRGGSKATPLPRLQWGRGVCLGNGVCKGFVSQDLILSFNGAEACASEMVEGFPGLCHPRHASMGPRRVPRKWVHAVDRRQIAPAASMGPRRVPRKWAKSLVVVLPGTLLQWGRGVCLGNGSDEHQATYHISWLQWGRGVCLGNGLPERTDALPPVTLQWGRGVCLGNG